jgi:hypothetical protein
VEDTVKTFLTANKLKAAAATVTFKFLEGEANRQPFQGQKGERFRVTVEMPYTEFKWSPLRALYAPDVLSSSTDWIIMVDDPFTINTTLPRWDPPPLN